jgi:IS30 family transposase
MEKVAAHLTFEERQRIYVMVGFGKEIPEIAKAINRDRSTVWRELRVRKKPPPWLWSAMTPLERAKEMHERAVKERTEWRRGSKKNLHQVSVQIRIVEMIEVGKRSAENVADILELSDEPEKMCGRTIRRWVDETDPGMKKHFPQQGKRRKKKEESPSTDNHMLSIHARPYAADMRKRAGDFEIDLIVCSQSLDCILTIRERLSRHIWLRKLPDRKAQTVRQELFRVFREIPPPLRLTATYDRDKAFSDLESFSRALQIDNYVCDAYCSWQKGAVENGNAQVRRFIPKGTDLSIITQGRLDEIAKWINITPLRCFPEKFSASQKWALESKRGKEMLH